MRNLLSLWADAVRRLEFVLKPRKKSAVCEKNVDCALLVILEFDTM